MAFMGYETPVEMPSMGVYNTDLMKMYIAGVRDQYEKGQEEMKDFLKTYGDFYSDVPGNTQMYNDLTIGGARRMLDQMQQAGIDPFKSPEARAAIQRYIWSVPTGKLNEMKRSAENAREYRKVEAKMKANGTWGSDDFQRAVLGGKLLDEWDPNKPFTATSPYEYKDLDALTAQQFTPFKAQEYLGQSRPGYVLKGTPQPRQESAIQAAIADLPNSVQGQYQISLAQKQVEAAAAAQGRTLTPQELEVATQQQLYENVKQSAQKFFQPKEEADTLRQGIILDNHRTQNDIRAYQRKAEIDHDKWKKEHPEYDPKSPFYKGNGGKPVTNSKTGKSYASWFEMMNDQQYVNMTNTGSHTFLNGQVKKLSNIFKKDKNGRYTSRDNFATEIDQAIRTMSQTVPNYTAATIFSRNANPDGTINISMSDVRKLFDRGHIVSRMKGSPIRVTSVQPNTKSLREDVKDLIGTNRKEGGKVAISVDNQFVYYVNKDGDVKIFMPIHIPKKDSDTEYEDGMIYTGISGKIDKNGSFVAHNEQYLQTIDKAMTHKFANKSDYSVPIDQEGGDLDAYDLYNYLMQSQPGFVAQ